MISNFQNIIFVLTLAVLTNSSEDITVLPQINREIADDYILCRNCGSDISSSNYIISKSSPVSRESYNDTLFNKTEVLIQVLSSDIFFHFPVITAAHSTCVSVGEWEEHDSWFPGCRWKPCVCPECGAYVGFVFEPIQHNLVSSSKQFFGLILTSLIGESCNYSFGLCVWGNHV